MRKQLIIVLSCAIGTLVCAAIAHDLGFDGHDLVEPDCDAMSHWFECRDIDTAPPGVYLGYLYMHHTSETLGPDGNTKYSDTGEPYVTTVTACSSCHFTGGHVPFGSPVYQSPSKYELDPETELGRYFRPLGYYRDLEDSIIDCFRNCMNAERAPAKDDPVMVALVNYIHWVRDGITDPTMQEDWTLLPPEAGTHLPSIAGVSSMRADPLRGALLYADNCSDCHDEDDPGAGEYRLGEIRPRIPALWGEIDGYSRGAAFYRTPVLAAYVQKHMPYGDPQTISDQDALDIAAHINAPDKARPGGMADQMYCHNDPDGIPSALRKPADWLVGCEYPGERQYFENQGIDFDDMVLNGPWDELTAWRAAEVQRLLAPHTVAGDSLTVTGGVLSQGTIAELADSDDQDVVIRRGFGDRQSKTEFELDSTNPFLTMSAMDVILEGSVSTRLPVDQSIELYNYQAAAWEQVDSQQANRFGDLTVTVSLRGDLLRFVQAGTGAMRARVRYQSRNRRHRFASFTDRFVWMITP